MPSFFHIRHWPSFGVLDALVSSQRVLVRQDIFDLEMLYKIAPRAELADTIKMLEGLLDELHRLQAAFDQERSLWDRTFGASKINRKLTARYDSIRERRVQAIWALTIKETV